ncbi:hypothetical protein V1509DRAFT_647253 [Lipomyces kononenkoae]
MQDAAAEITRCICGHDELQTDDPEIDSGLFIQCDKCQVWQHAYCVGIGPDDNLTEDYSCEKCRPELHLVVVRPTGKTSKYIPLLEAKQSRSKERSSRHSSRSEQSSTRRSNPSSSGTANSESSHKRRSTLNSRDSAYEEVLRRVLEVSAHEISGGAAGSDSETAKSGRSMRGKKRAAQAAFEDDEPDEDFKREDDNDDEEEAHQHRRRRRTNGTTKHTYNDDDSRSSEDKKNDRKLKEESTENGMYEDEDNEENNDIDEDGEEDISDDVVSRLSHRNGLKRSSAGKRDRSRRSRATQSPTETADENSSSRRSRNGRTTSSSKKSSRGNGSPDENDDADEDVESEGNLKSRASPDELPSGIDTAADTPDEKPVSATTRKDVEGDELSKESSNKDKPSPAANSNQSRSRRSRKQQTTVDRDDDTDTSTATGRATSIGVTVEKPSKPRIPQGKSSIMEMRKRVAAILEFIGRTQVDMAIEQDERRKLHLQRRKLGPTSTSSVAVSTGLTKSASATTLDNDEVDTLFGTQKISLDMMDGLTRKLLIWEQQFGRHGDKN